ncbi:alpha/beta hydrolase [Nonomuraea sp. NPDC046802]|uniref:alpha/beta fold hydrolase n=1 Tax=Nonomuraea sp. NPDC046802 TaxID=3154919 RepID=UPI003408EB3C
MYIREAGNVDGPVLVLIHGGGVAGWMWQAQIEHFAARHRLLVPDLPGHDHSHGTAFTTSTAVVAELAAHLNRLPAGADVTVVGFSLGAQIAVELVATHPELVTRVVVVSALTRGVALASLGDRLVGLTAPLARQTWFARLQAKALFVPNDLLDDYLRTSKALPKDSLLALTRANSAFRVPPAWRTFPGPSLLLAGDKEPRALREGMRQLGRDHANSELVVHPGAGHGLPLQHPEWFNTRVGDWLRRHL